MRVLQMMADGSPGGGSTHLLQILSGFKKFFPFGLVTQKESYLEAESRKLEIPTFGVKFFRSRIDPVVPFQIRQIVNEFNPDLVHVHGSRAGFGYLMSGVKTPMVYTVHGHHFPHKNILMRWFAIKAERRICRLATHVIFVCRHDLLIAETHNLLPADTPRDVIYCGISFNDIPTANTTDRRQVGLIGRLVEQKDPLLFLDCLELLPEYEATIVGGGELVEKVKAEIARRSLCNVKMLGALPRREALQALSKLAVLVMTSRWEGLPILALEAMCAGVPVVAIDVGGIGEAIEDGRSGILVKSRSPDELAKAVKRLTHEESFRKSIIVEARERVQKLFTEQRMISEIRKVYEERTTTSSLKLGDAIPS